MDNDTLTERELLLKADGVRDCVKWIEKEIKELKQLSGTGDYDYCGYTQTRIKTLVDMKISLEKYMKKLKHMANERCTEYDY